MIAEKTAPLGERVARIRAVLDRILKDPPDTMLDLKRRLTDELAFDPNAHFLQALPALREIVDPAGRELGLRALILHVAIASSARELLDSERLDPAGISRGVETIPPLLAMIATVERGFAEMIGSIDRMHRDRVAKIHETLRLPEAPLHAATIVGPELARLGTAARGGTLAEAAPNLTTAESDAIVSMSSAGGATTRPDRALVNAIALRMLIERDVSRFLELPASCADDATTEIHAELRLRLEAGRGAHAVVGSRLDAARAERLARGGKANPLLDQARRTLFAAYRELVKALAGEFSDADGGLAARILEAEAQAAAVDAEHETTRDLLRHAAADAAPATMDAPVAAKGVQDLARERRRRMVLLGVAAGLVPIAVTANVLLYPRGNATPKVSSELLAPAMAVREVVPIGEALYSQVARILWDDLSEAERRGKVSELGRLASQRGYRVLLVVDESRRELARRSATGGAELGHPSEAH